MEWLIFYDLMLFTTFVILTLAAAWQLKRLLGAFFEYLDKLIESEEDGSFEREWTECKGEWETLCENLIRLKIEAAMFAIFMLSLICATMRVFKIVTDTCVTKIRNLIINRVKRIVDYIQVKMEELENAESFAEDVKNKSLTFTKNYLEMVNTQVLLAINSEKSNSSDDEQIRQMFKDLHGKLGELLVHGLESSLIDNHSEKKQFQNSFVQLMRDFEIITALLLIPENNTSGPEAQDDRLCKLISDFKPRNRSVGRPMRGSVEENPRATVHFIGSKMNNKNKRDNLSEPAMMMEDEYWKFFTDFVKAGTLNYISPLINIKSANNNSNLLKICDADFATEGMECFELGEDDADRWNASNVRMIEAPAKESQTTDEDSFVDSRERKESESDDSIEIIDHADCDNSKEVNCRYVYKQSII